MHETDYPSSMSEETIGFWNHEYVPMICVEIHLAVKVRVEAGVPKVDNLVLKKIIITSVSS